MYIYVHAYTHIHIYIHTYTHASAYKHTHICRHIQIFKIYINIYTQIPTYINMHIQARYIHNIWHTYTYINRMKYLVLIDRYTDLKNVICKK